MHLKQLWDMSGTVQTEIFWTTRLDNSGQRKDVIIDRYEGNLASMKSSFYLNSIFVSVILIFPAVLAISSLEQSIGFIDQGNFEKIFFTNSISIASYYIFNMVFMLLFGMMTIANLLKGEVFRFLHTLPLTKSQIQIVTVLTFVRLLIFQLIVMLFAFPLGVAYITESWSLTAVIFVINAINLVFIIYVLILAINFLSRSLFGKEQGFNLKTVLRYIFVILYIIIAFSIYFFVNAASQFLLQLYELNQLSEGVLEIINLLLSVVVFPFSSGYLYSILILEVRPTLPLLTTTSLGFVLFLFLLYRIVKKGNTILLNIAFKQQDTTTAPETKIEEIRISATRPILAYLKMNTLTVLRDMSASISIIMAILFPLIPLIQGRNQDPFINFLFYSAFIVFLTNNALSVSEGTVGGLLSSLPFSNRQMLRGKHLLITSIFLLSFTILSAVTLGRFLTFYRILLVVVLGIILPNVFLVLKSYFFGKINNQYTLFDIEDSSNLLRNLVIIVPVVMVIGMEFLIHLFIENRYDLIESIALFSGFNIGIGMLLEIINRKMFR